LLPFELFYEFNKIKLLFAKFGLQNKEAFVSLMLEAIKSSKMLKAGKD